MKPTRSPISSNRQPALPPTRSPASSKSNPRACTSAYPWSLDRRAKSRASPATTPNPALSASVRRCSVAAACSEPERHDVSQASHHHHHRVVGRRHNLGQAHLRADLPAREHRGSLHRRRRLSSLRPRGDEGGGRREGKGGQPELHPLPCRGQRVGDPRGDFRGIWPPRDRKDPHLRP